MRMTGCGELLVVPAIAVAEGRAGLEMLHYGTLGCPQKSEAGSSSEAMVVPRYLAAGAVGCLE